MNQVDVEQGGCCGCAGLTIIVATLLLVGGVIGWLVSVVAPCVISWC